MNKRESNFDDRDKFLMEATIRIAAGIYSDRDFADAVTEEAATRGKLIKEYIAGIAREQAIALWDELHPHLKGYV